MDSPVPSPAPLISDQMIWETIHGQRQFYQYHVPVAKLFGITDAVFICFLIWKQYRADDPVELLVDDIEAGTALSYDMQKGIRKRLKAAGILEERTLRLQHKTFYKIDVAKLDEMLKAIPDSAPAIAPSGANPISSNKNNSCNNREPLPATRTGRKSSGEKDQAPKEKGQHQQFIDDWCECYEAQFGTRYVVLGGADGKAAKGLLSGTKLPASDLIKVATAAWARSGKAFWACENKSRTIRDFAANWNRILGELDRPMPGQIQAAPVIDRITAKPPEGLKPFSAQPPPGYDEQMNKISHAEWLERFPISNYYDDLTFKPL